MIDFDDKTKYCIEINCITKSIYNYIGEKKAIYCYEHSKPDMVNIKSIKCIEENCVLLPSCN